MICTYSENISTTTAMRNAKRDTHKPRVSKDSVMPLLEDPVDARLLELRERPFGHVRLVREHLILVQRPEVCIISSALPKQLEQLEVVGRIARVVRGRRGEGVAELCLFVIHGAGAAGASVLGKR